MTQTHPQFLLYLGDTWTLDAALHDIDGGALDLSGADINWNLQDRNRTIVAALTIDDGIEIANAIGGLCRITVPPAKTATLAEATYNDEIRVTLSDGTVSTQAVGSIVTTRAGSPPPVATENPCEILAALQKARLDLMTGQRQVSVSLEGFSVTYSDKGDIASLDAAITRYDGLCAKARGQRPRRYAARAGQMFRRHR